MLIDSHAHLSMSQFDRDRGEVVSWASKAGLLFIFTAGIDAPSSPQALATSRTVFEFFGLEEVE